MRLQDTRTATRRSSSPYTAVMTLVPQGRDEWIAAIGCGFVVIAVASGSIAYFGRRLPKPTRWKFILSSVVAFFVAVAVSLFDGPFERWNGWPKSPLDWMEFGAIILLVSVIVLTLLEAFSAFPPSKHKRLRVWVKALGFTAITLHLVAFILRR